MALETNMNLQRRYCLEVSSRCFHYHFHRFLTAGSCNTILLQNSCMPKHATPDRREQINQTATLPSKVCRPQRPGHFRPANGRRSSSLIAAEGRLARRNVCDSATEIYKYMVIQILTIWVQNLISQVCHTEDIIIIIIIYCLSWWT